jgi:hypothetical protein
MGYFLGSLFFLGLALFAFGVFGNMYSKGLKNRPDREKYRQEKNI